MDALALSSLERGLGEFTLEDAGESLLSSTSACSLESKAERVLLGILFVAVAADEVESESIVHDIAQNDERGCKLAGRLE